MRFVHRPAPLVLALALACCGGEPPPWSTPPELPLDLRLTLSATEIPLLEPFTVTLDLFRQDGVECTFAPHVAGDAFVTKSTTIGPELPFGGGRWRRAQIVLLPATGPGEATLPPFVVKSADGAATATTPERTIVVTSVVAGHGEDIEAPGEPFEAPLPWRWIAVGALLAIGAGACFVWWRRRAPSAPRQRVLSPHEHALAELERLRTASRRSEAEVEAFYVAVSQVLRVYIERRFHLRAPERTTEEFLRDLEASDGPIRRHRLELERFLAQCDLVKFAAVRPNEAEHEATWRTAHDFVVATAPAEVGT
jgi:hypothetical protein